MTGVIKVVIRQRVVALAPVRQERFDGEIDFYAVVDAVDVALAARIDQEIRLGVQFHVKPGLKKIPEEIVRLAEPRPEIAKIEANFSHVLLAVKFPAARRRTTSRQFGGARS